MSKSTRKPGRRKAAWNVAGFIIKRPYPDFPLSPHPSGKWQKRIRTDLLYFGNWAKRVNGKLVRVEGDGWEAALAIYKAQADNLHAGRTPRIKGDGLTVGYLCSHFLTAMLRRLGLSDEEIKGLNEIKTSWAPFLAGRVGRKMSPRMLMEYKATTDRLIKKFGAKRLVDDLAADDFAALGADLDDRKGGMYGTVRFGNEVQKVRTIFKYGIDNGLITKVILYGSEFKKPDKTDLRKHRAKQGPKLFAADEIRSMIDGAGPQLKAMILLGINAAFGNADCGQLPLSALDLEGGWVTFPRPKTGIERRAKLWPETAAALREAVALRPEPKDAAHANLVFITKYGGAWSTGGTSSPVAHEVGKLLRRLKINGRHGLGHYALRHTFRTVADATKDVNAIRCIMGHTDDSIDANYTHGIDDARLVAVAEHVRQWLFGKPGDDGAKGEHADRAVSVTGNENAETPCEKERPRLKLYAEVG